MQQMQSEVNAKKQTTNLQTQKSQENISDLLNQLDEHQNKNNAESMQVSSD